MKTDFNDRTGKPLHTGDIVIYNLGSSGKKSGGPITMRMVKAKKVIKLVNQFDKGWPMRKTYEQYITLIDTRHRDKE